MIEVFENTECIHLDEPEHEETFLATCYGVKCDLCGTLHEHTDYGCDRMTDSSEMEDDALCYGDFKKFYSGTDNEYHLCPDCAEKAYRYIDFIDNEGLCPADDEVYAEVDIPLDATHVVRYTLCDDEVIGTRIVAK